jgi:hypothetical protein
MTKTANAIRKTVLAVTVAGLGVSPCTMAARADVVFDFSGTCTIHCSGTATGVLDLTNAYVFGSTITAADFVSFSYTSSDINFTITHASSPIFMGGLNADGTIVDEMGVFAIGVGNFPTFDIEDKVNFDAAAGLMAGELGTSATFIPAATLLPAALPLSDIASISNETDSVGQSGKATTAPQTPIPAPLLLFATGLSAIGLLSWRRKRKASVSLLGTA